MKLSGKTYLLLGIGLVAAAGIAAQSFAIMSQKRAPTRSLALGLSYDGTAKASAANLMQATRIARDPRSVPTKVEVALAREAFASEPLTASAFPILVQAANAMGQHGQARQLLLRAGQLTRRDDLLNAMLIDDATKQNDFAGAVRLLGRAMAVNEKVRDLYVGRMVMATASLGALKILPPLLGRNPSWSKEYWTAISGNTAVIPNGAKIRLKIAGPPWKLNKAYETDFRLIRELAKLDPAASFSLAQALGAPKPVAGELLVDPHFRREARFSPFDWELLQSGDIGADIDPEIGRLTLSSLPVASGIAARQLVHIAAPGRYHLRWKVAGLPEGGDASLKFRLACVDRSKSVQPIAPVLLSQGTGNATFDVRAANCDWYWVTLELDTSNSASGVDVEVSQLSLRRDGAAPTAHNAASPKF